MSDSKYKALVAMLKKNILDGKYGNEGRFPSVRALIRRHGLSNTTVLHAVDELVRQERSQMAASRVHRLASY